MCDEHRKAAASLKTQLLCFLKELGSGRIVNDVCACLERSELRKIQKRIVYLREHADRCAVDDYLGVACLIVNIGIVDLCFKITLIHRSCAKCLKCIEYCRCGSARTEYENSLAADFDAFTLEHVDESEVVGIPSLCFAVFENNGINAACRS